MITTTTDIVNRSLRKLGANKLLTDIDNTSDKNAIIMKDLYDDSLRVVLSETYWLFATKRVELDLTSDGVDVKWTKNNLVYIYDVPDDLIRLIGWSESYQNVRQEGNYFISDSNGGNTTISVNESSVSDWVTATAYALGAFSVSDESVYYCKATHSSSASDEPGVGASWEDFWTLMREESTGVWTAVIEKNLGLLYLYYNTTIAQYPPYFIEAFVDKLALDASYMLVQSKTNTERLELRYEATLSDAKAKNGQGQTPNGIRADAWTGAKYAGHNSWDDVGLYYR
jgi:hypothetical protein